MQSCLPITNYQLPITNYLTYITALEKGYIKYELAAAIFLAGC